MKFNENSSSRCILRLKLLLYPKIIHDDDVMITIIHDEKARWVKQYLNFIYDEFVGYCANLMEVA